MKISEEIKDGFNIGLGIGVTVLLVMTLGGIGLGIAFYAIRWGLGL